MLTDKQEKFAQAVAKGLNQSAAYREAYNATKMQPQSVSVNASKLMADANVALRVSVLRELAQPERIKAVAYGIDQAMAEAERALKIAEKKENGGAMVAAVTLRAKLNALLVDRSEVRTGKLDDVPAGELEAIDAAIDVIRKARATASGVA